MRVCTASGAKVTRARTLVTTGPARDRTAPQGSTDGKLHRLGAKRAPAFVATGYSGRVTHARWVSNPYVGEILNFSPRQNDTTDPRTRGLTGTRRQGRVEMGTYPTMGTRFKHAATFRPYGRDRGGKAQGGMGGTTNGSKKINYEQEF